MKSGISCKETMPPAGLCNARRWASSGSFIIKMGCTPTLRATLMPSKVSVRNIVFSWGRDALRSALTSGVKSAPLVSALRSASLPQEKTMFLTDTLEGIKVARSVGVHPILMMNDPDEAQRLALHNPAGGIVSLHEMPDFIRLIAAQNQRT